MYRQTASEMAHWRLVKGSFEFPFTLSETNAKAIFFREQDSPPAGNHKRRTTRGVTCPSVTCPGGGRGYPSPVMTGWGLPQVLSWLAGGGGYPSPILARGYPCPGVNSHLGLGYAPAWDGLTSLAWDWGTPHPPTDWGTLLERTCNQLLEVLWDGDGVPRRWWTNWKHYLPSSFGCGR